MPDYAWLLESKAEFDAIPQRMRGMRMLGVPYTDEEIEHGIEDAQKQADEIVAKIKEYEAPERVDGQASHRPDRLPGQAGPRHFRAAAGAPQHRRQHRRPVTRMQPGSTAEPETTMSRGNLAIDRRSPADGPDGRGAWSPSSAIVAWTFLRPRERIEADAQLWKDDR